MSFLPKYVSPKKPKEINAKVFNMTTNRNKTKTITKHVSCDCEYKLNSTTCNLHQKLNNKTCQCVFKNYRKCKEDCSSNLITYISDNSKYLKSIAYTSVIACDETVDVMDIVSTKMTNTISTNVTNLHSKKVRYKLDCYILHTG